MNKFFLLMLTALIVLCLAGCAKTKVTRTETDLVTDLSGRWNDTDARLVAEEMIKDILSNPWYAEFVNKYGRKPVVIVGTIRNLTMEHIDTAVFINDMERELINSGMVKFVASPAERFELREETESQQSFATAETAKKMAAETGADLMLQGSLSMITDAREEVKAKYYQTDLKLISLESTEKVWIGTNKIKKIVSKGTYKP